MAFTSEPREVVGQRSDLLIAQRISHLGHSRHTATDTDTGLVVMQCFDQVVLALACDARDGLGTGEIIAVA
jgi:hypothetical protein